MRFLVPSLSLLVVATNYKQRAIISDGRVFNNLPLLIYCQKENNKFY